MRAEHVAIDGSKVRVQADAEISSPVTSAGWAIVPSLMQSHPFTVHPPGHTSVVEDTVRSSLDEIQVGGTEELSLKGGTLRVAEVRLPTATGEQRVLSVGGWEGRKGCLATSLVGPVSDKLVEVFDTLRFSERGPGLTVDSPVTPRPRAPEVIQEIPGLGIVSMRPALAGELEGVPRRRGRPTPHGELFRVRENSRALIFVSESAVARISPLEEDEEEDPDSLLEVAHGLAVDWIPRGRR